MRSLLVPCSAANIGRKRASTGESTTQTSPPGGHDHDDRSIDPGRSRPRARCRWCRSDNRGAASTENGRSSANYQHAGADHDDSRADHDSCSDSLADHDCYPHDSGIINHPSPDLVRDTRAHHYAGGADLCVDPTIAAGPVSKRLRPV
ncbi:hypothetical protein, partial [Rhodococcus jostii]|uniref:hypothetical protein n=1 Tax=Rhodococcus jostii TaxID=132919 RepID=UPI003640C473